MDDERRLGTHGDGQTGHHHNHLPGATATTASDRRLRAHPHATVGYFLVDDQRYEEVRLDEQVDVVSLLGDIAAAGDSPVVHAHVVLVDWSARARADHLLSAAVRPTLEVMLTEPPPHLRRRSTLASASL